MTSPENAKSAEKAPVEIERKFLIDGSQVPARLDSYRHERIDQGYLVLGDDGSEARVRDRAGTYTLTVKSKGELSRGEYETPITKEQFDVLWPATSGKRVEKTRYTIPYESSTIELDIYEGHLAGLISAEVEFDSEDAAHAFAAPEWFGPDVTADKSFKNQSLALYGAPNP